MVCVVPSTMRVHAVGSAVVQHLWLFVENPANAVAAVFAHNGVVVGFAMLLDDVADIPQGHAWFGNFDALIKDIPESP